MPQQGAHVLSTGCHAQVLIRGFIAMNQAADGSSRSARDDAARAEAALPSVGSRPPQVRLFYSAPDP